MKGLSGFKTKRIILAFLAAAFLCSASAAFSLDGTVRANVVSGIQSQYKTIDKNGTFELFGAEGDIKNDLSWYCDSSSIRNNFTAGDGEVSFNNQDSSGINENNGNFFIRVELSENMRRAVSNGAVGFKADVMVKSGISGSHDVPDKLYAELIFGIPTGEPSFSKTDNGAADNNFQIVYQAASPLNGNSYDSYTQFSVSVPKEELAGKVFTHAMLHVRSEYVESPDKFLGIPYVTRNIIYMTEPEISAFGDDTAPSAEFEISETGWSCESKTLTVTVTDAESGIFKAVCNGKELTASYMSEDTRTASYTVPVADNGSYTFIFTDNSGNSVTEVFTENNIDKEVPELSVEIDELFHTRRGISFSAYPKGNVLSEQRFYWTVDGSLPDESSAELIADGTENLFDVGDNGDYTLNILGIDEAGNRALYSFPFKVDDTVYNITVSAVNGRASAEKNGAMYGETVKITYSADDGCELYGIFLNGAKVDSLESVTVTGNVSIEIIYRRRVTLALSENVFVFCGGEIELPFVADGCEPECFRMEYMRDGSSVEAARDAGKYVLNYSVDNDKFIGEGSLEFTVLPKEIIPVDITERYEYSPEFVFSFGLDTDVECIRVEFTLDGETAEPCAPAEYGYRFYSDDPNYTVEKSGTFVITKKKVVFSVSGADMYDKTEHTLEITPSENAEYVVEMYYNGEKTDVLFAAGDYHYKITVIDNEFYEGVMEGVHTVRARPLKVTVRQGQYKYYGETDPELKYTVEGLLSGDTVSGAPVREKGENAGIYAITAGSLHADNYVVETAEAYFTVMPRKIAVKTLSCSKIYGQSDPRQFEFKLLYGCLADGDYITVSREQGENAGVYVIDGVTVLNALGEDVSGNYSVIPVFGNFEIEKKTVKVTPYGFSKIYGDTDGDITFTADGLIGEDKLSGSLSRESGEDAGSYRITVGTLNNHNYKIVLGEAYCNILPRHITVTADNGSKIYGDADGELTYTVENLVFGDVLGGSLSRESGEDAGVYAITIGTLNGKNYVIDFVGATFTVERREITVVIGDAEKTYGENDPEFTYTVENANDTDAADYGIVLSREQGEKAGQYVITATCGDNFVMALTQGTLTIAKARVELEVKDRTVIYNGSAQFMPQDENLDLIYEYYLFGEKVESPVNAGVYTVKAIFKGNDCFAYAETQATFTIEKKILGAVVDLSPRTYTGEEILPVVVTENNVPVIIEFENGVRPIERGEYKFTVRMEDENTYLFLECILVIE